MIKDLELTLELYETIVPRIINVSLGGENWYSIDQDDSLPDYNRFILNENLGKPSLERIESEFQEYKNELLAFLHANIATVLNQIKYPKIVLNAIDSDKKPSVYLSEFYQNEDLDGANAALDIYNQQMTIRENEQELQDKKMIGQKVRSMCDSALDVIIGYNVTRTLTPAQQNEMKTIYADIFQALKDYQPATAKALIQVVTVDGTLTTQSMKDDILKEL